ncbi:TPA: SEC10/PgrA surface exclusion domain-containing protein [Streptococcus suis]|nr:SEC10/PgrA surface exclusion domain-containing protein [Streptococcus suis]
MKNLVETDAILTKHAGLDKIVLPEGYVASLQAYVEAGKEGIDGQIEVCGEEGLALNTYVGCEEDKEIALSNIEDLDSHIRVELANYASTLINPLREQLGSVAVEVSDLAIDYAKSLAESLNNSLRFHNYDSLIAIAKIKGVEPKGKDCLAFSEYKESYTLYDAKELLYKALTWRLFDDSHADYGHAAIILGLDKEESGVEEIGFAFSKYSLDIDWMLTHMIFIPKDWILENK